MKKTPTLAASSHEQELLRVVTQWAVEYAELTLPIFEHDHPDDPRPRDAIEAAKAFGKGKKRDKNLRVVAMAAMRAGKDVDDAAKYAARAAMLAAAVAYTHTDLQTGIQGIRQAQHILGPIVYAALAVEEASSGDTAASDAIIRRASASAPSEVRQLLEHMPPQPKDKTDRAGILFTYLDATLRDK